ncbi:recombinase family protein [Rhodobacter capsulatus]|uniref:recombinase family protein n=1 Tax=Rhodobacter capsulatus TaxID=1061 RepID=UPI0009C0CAE1|nr:recombinase family protein [Rhodobacter capsulatus]
MTTRTAAPRAAIYARYSSDLQSAASIPDQVRLCRRLCEERGWTVVEVFADEAMSGASHLRPDFQRMQQAAMAGQFDVLVAEALDRLSRDQEHIAGLHKRMRFLGVEIFTKAEGAISEMHIGLGGTMSALFLRNLAEKTHRGLEGRVKAGKSAGGISYGYRLDRQPLPDGTYTTGDRVIDAAEAAIIRRIFTEYDRGRSARAIAIGLNRDGIPAPRSGGKGKGSWSFSTISGNWKRGTGILNNELYIGRLVWNRQRFVKDPDTGKRQARPNPPGDWITEEVPYLRIISDDQWTRVKQRQGAIREDILTERAADPDGPKIERGHRPRYLLSGLLSCGCCGSGYIMISDSRLGCAAARNSGTCLNRKTIKRIDVEARVLGGLKHHLMHPDLVAEFIAEFHREMENERREGEAGRVEAERALSKVTKELENIVTAITEGMFHPSMKAKMDALEAQKAGLEAKLAALPAPSPVILHLGIADVYAAKISDLAEALNDAESRPEAVEILRGLIEKIVLRPDADAANGHVIELYGELGSILSLCGNGMGQNAKTHAVGVGLRQLTMVAGAGFEPAAFRL